MENAALEDLHKQFLHSIVILSIIKCFNSQFILTFMRV